MSDRIKRPKTKQPSNKPNKKFTHAKGAGNGKGFEPGHKKSIGNRGPEFRALNRFITARIRAKLLELDPQTRAMNVHAMVDALFELAMQGGEDGQPLLGAIIAIMDRVEGKPAQAVIAEISGPGKGPIVTVDTPLEELAERYGEMIGAQSVNGRND
jgi:hypothetical protein